MVFAFGTKPPTGTITSPVIVLREKLDRFLLECLLQSIETFRGGVITSAAVGLQSELLRIVLLSTLVMNESKLEQIDLHSDGEIHHLKRMGLKEPSHNGLPPSSNGDDKNSVINFEFSNRPSKLKLNESGQTTQGTYESISSADESPDHQQSTHDNNSEAHTNGVGPLHQQHDDGNTKQSLHNELTSLHTSTHQAIQLSYLEQEHLSNDINKMQSRISYLKRKIGLARQELIAKCGAHMNDELLRLSLVKEVDSVDMSDDEGGGCGNGEGKDFEVTFESFKSNEHNLISNNNNSNNNFIKVGSQNSGLSSGPSSHDDSDVVSGSSSLFRITFGGIDGMPSRWRNREMERERERSELLAKKNSHGSLVKDEWLPNDDSDSVAGDETDDDAAAAADDNKDAAAATENAKEQQLITLKQLVNDRESEISFLEKEMMTVEKEKSSIENDISTMTSDMERSKIDAENEKDKLLGVIDLCQLDNRRLEKALLETTVSLGVNKMNIELLGNDLRDARKKFIEFQMRKERKKYERKREQRIDIPYLNEGNSASNNGSNQPLRVQRYEVPINMGSYRDAGERKPGSARNTTALSNSGLSMESAVTTMSALTSDFSDVVDVLEGVGSTTSSR